METWLPSLLTETPELGFDLAIKLSRVAVKKTQPDEQIRLRLREVYEKDADALIASSQVVAINFQTVAAANGYWRT
ncbi:hexameric tyrosine-coordinated heme protein [Caulobacter soli]|uniref:hexameric tyrosine-coordinated heme protein n=1 Tax=Caulobacter soli TaxID=2708539 RepID=UPI001FEB99FF|nr:hexameric tyrosine-coordinated heme protein [Caulobacter soli]